MTAAAHGAEHPQLRVHVQVTPNPKARKLVANRVVKQGGNVLYKVGDPVPAGAGPMVEALLGVEHITHVYLSENVITVTQDGEGDWDALCGTLRKHIAATIDAHDATFDPVPEANPVGIVDNCDDPHLIAISEVIDRTIRPYLQSHGGELDLVAYDPDSHQLTVRFRGSCDGCAGSTGGTVYALEGILRAEFDPHLTIYVQSEYAGVW